MIFHVGGRNATFALADRRRLAASLPGMSVLQTGRDCEYEPVVDLSGADAGPLSVVRTDGLALNMAEKAALYWFFVGFMNGSGISPASGARW